MSRLLLIVHCSIIIEFGFLLNDACGKKTFERQRFTVTDLIFFYVAGITPAQIRQKS